MLYDALDSNIELGCTVFWICFNSPWFCSKKREDIFDIFSVNFSLFIHQSSACVDVN